MPPDLPPTITNTATQRFLKASRQPMSSSKSKPPENANIRTLLETDLAAAIELWSASEGVELAEGDRPDELQRYLRRNPHTSFGAYQGKALVGAVLGGHDGRRGFLYHLSVASEFRGHGLGRALVEQSLGSLRTEGIARVLILVARDNPQGAAFWRSVRWEPLDFAEPMGIDL
jgi:ribosomal protein S18 acetylase RimI-like enzyme